MIGVIYFTLITFLLSILIVVLNNLLFNGNNKEEEIVKLLPGYNCGACGFGSCSGMAKELLKNKNNISKCKIVKNKEEIFKCLGD